MPRKKLTAAKQAIQVEHNTALSNVQAMPSALNPEVLIMKALETNVPVESLERLLSMRTDLMREQAIKDYHAAMSVFQEKCPIIEKTKTVYNKDGQTVRYKYAPLESVKKQIGELLKECGFSYSFDTKVSDEWVTAFVTATHIGGHSETSEFKVQIDRDAYMNIAQQVASARTFAKRCAFLDVFGILTGEDDDDAQSAGVAKTQADLENKAAILMSTVLSNIDTVMEIKNALNAVTTNGPEPDYNYAAQLLEELKTETFQIIWTAPSKGGPFTTAEREMIRKNVTPIIQQIRKDKIAERNAKKDKP